jgi:hypothetical protein
MYTVLVITAVGHFIMTCRSSIKYGVKAKLMKGFSSLIPGGTSSFLCKVIDIRWTTDAVFLYVIF